MLQRRNLRLHAKESLGSRRRMILGLTPKVPIGMSCVSSIQKNPWSQIHSLNHRLATTPILRPMVNSETPSNIQPLMFQRRCTLSYKLISTTERSPHPTVFTTRDCPRIGVLLSLELSARNQTQEISKCTLKSERKSSFVLARHGFGEVQKQSLAQSVFLRLISTLF